MSNRVTSTTGNRPCFVCHEKNCKYRGMKVDLCMRDMFNEKEEKPQKRDGWHPASEKQPEMGEQIVTWVNHGDGTITVSRGAYVGWPKDIINKLWWCYPPQND